MMSKGVAREDEFARAPFPYFGGKVHCSKLVWDAIGDVDSYTEPFGGSLGVLLQRPHYPFEGRIGRVELVNDKDHFVSNFWRATKADPQSVAYYIDNPVHERDLESRHYWLVTEGIEDLRGKAGDPEYYNAKIAGWWAWGMCNWIGNGWCSDKGKWAWNAESGVWESVTNNGVTHQIPHLGNTGRGVTRGMPHLSNTETGISKLVKQQTDPEYRFADSREFAYDWIQWLSNRIRSVRVIQGEWDRALSESALGGITMKHFGIFLDPPYTVGVENVYRESGENGLAHSVREWAIERGKDERFRIVFAGYDAEGHLFPDTWRKEHWKFKGGYSGTKKELKETLWFSPGCLTETNLSLF